MKCPNCGSEREQLKVVDTRHRLDSNSTRRRYECGECLTRFTTLEYLYGHRDDELERFEGAVRAIQDICGEVFGKYALDEEE